MSQQGYYVPESVLRLSEKSSPERIQAGDVWQINWDEIVRYAVIAQVIDDYVLAMPVSFALDDLPTDVVVIDQHSWAGDAPLVIWPELETGLGLHLLNSCLGTVLKSTELTRIREIVTSSEDTAQSKFGAGARRSATRDQLAGEFSALCLIEWKDQIGRHLDRDSFDAAGGHFGLLEEILNHDPALALDAIQGNLVLSQQEAAKIAGKLGVREDEIAPEATLPFDLEFALSMPQNKNNVRSLARKLALPEGEIRRRAAENLLGRAARQPGEGINWIERVSTFIAEAIKSPKILESEGRRRQ